MSGIGFRDGVLEVRREPNELDELAVEVSSVLSRLDIEHAFVAGYVAILAGRSRSTEDIDAILEPLSKSRAATLADELRDAGLWGSAMPLDDLSTMLSDGSNIRVAREDEVIPNVELKYATDEFDRESLDSAITEVQGESPAVHGGDESDTFMPLAVV